MMTFDNLMGKLSLIEDILGYSFQDKSLLSLAFIHRSFINESKESIEHNERLEFLGDSVLGLVMADYLFKTFPTTSEGELSYLRSRLVEATACASYIQELKLQEFVLLGRGERMNDGRGRESILADLFEAVVGAIYLDGGLDAVKVFLFKNLKEKIEAIIKTPLKNYKALLQDYCQKNYGAPPEYVLLSESGPDHNKNFEIEVLINGEARGKGFGASKKVAQQNAAKDALEKAM